MYLAVFADVGVMILAQKITVEKVHIKAEKLSFPLFQ